MLLRMWKIVSVGTIFLFGLYFWYVQGVDIWPYIEKARNIQIEITFKKTSRQLASPHFDPRLGSWETLPSMPTSRTEAAVAALGSKIYVIGGLDGFGRTRNIVEVYDTESKTWEEGVPLPEARHHAMAVVLDNKLYVLGGHAGLNFEPTKKMWVFRSVTDEWEELAHLPEAIGAGAAVAIDTVKASKNKLEVLTSGKIYVFGGMSPEGVSENTFAYDPKADKWEIKKHMPTGREHLGAAAIGDTIYVVGGREGSVTRNLNVLEAYSVQKNTWETLPDMSVRRGGIAVAALNGKLYVFGGEHTTETISATEEFDPETRTWNNMNPMPDARHGLGAAAVDGKIYVIGGGKRPLLSVSKINTAFTPAE